MAVLVRVISTVLVRCQSDFMLIKISAAIGQMNGLANNNFTSGAKLLRSNDTQLLPLLCALSDGTSCTALKICVSARTSGKHFVNNYNGGDSSFKRENTCKFKWTRRRRGSQLVCANKTAESECNSRSERAILFTESYFLRVRASLGKH